MRRFLFALCLVVPACGGKVDIAPGGDAGSDTGVVTCDPAACGPNALGAPLPCPDGTIPADICARDTDGACRWRSAGCPAAKECGAFVGGECAPGQYCSYASCPAPGAKGSCVAKPGGDCPEIYSPVCSCDGKTYANACFAAADGAIVASNGECGSTGRACSDRSSCGKSEFCSFPDGLCPASTAPGPTPPKPAGTCKALPFGCPDLYAPVCGCDGKTYGNHCEADAMGINVMRAGTCEGPPPPDRVCGGFVGATCNKDEWCDYPTSNCGGADEDGVCRPRPAGCDFTYAPVCGCNGKTYANECVANQAGVDIRAKGPCK